MKNLNKPIVFVSDRLRSQTFRSLSVYFWAGLILYLFCRVLLLKNRFFDPDEFVQLHSAWCLSHGLVIYRDFFDGYIPLLQYLLAPITAITNDPIGALWAARSLMFMVFLSMLWLQSRIASSTLEKQLSVLFLCSFTTFAEKSLEIRADVPAVGLLSAAAVLCSQTLTTQRAFLIGLFLALGFLFSPKILFPGTGLVLGLLWSELQHPTRRAQIRNRTASMAMGALWPAVGFLAFLLVDDHFKGFYQDFWTFHHHGVFISVWPYLLGSLKENPVLYALSIAGLWINRANLPMVGLLAGFIVGLPRPEMPYRQYYLYLGLVLGMFSAKAAQVGFLELQKRVKISMEACFVLTLVVLSPSFWSQLQDLKYRNEHQIENIRCIMAHTSEKDKVFDVWSGASFYRLHAYRIFYLTDEIQHMMSPEHLIEIVLKSLADPACKAFIWDRNFNELPPTVLHFARQHYRFAHCGQLYLRDETAK